MAITDQLPTYIPSNLKKTGWGFRRMTLSGRTKEHDARDRCSMLSSMRDRLKGTVVSNETVSVYDHRIQVTEGKA